MSALLAAILIPVSFGVIAFTSACCYYYNHSDNSDCTQNKKKLISMLLLSLYIWILIIPAMWFFNMLTILLLTNYAEVIAVVFMVLLDIIYISLIFAINAFTVNHVLELQHII